MGETRNAYKVLIGKHEGKRPLRICTHRWEDKIRKDLRETRGESVDWIHLTLDRDQWQALLKW
jgi:hypothetical protein